MENNSTTKFGLHENLVRFSGVHADGLLFEYCGRGSLADVINGPIPLSTEQKLAIGEHITRCLVHLHERNYIRCDLNASNVFFTSDLIAKVGDIQGQLYGADGTIEMQTMSEENSKSRHPSAGENEFSPRTDIFALGTLLYNLRHGHLPFPELDENEQTQEEEILAIHRKGEFPINVEEGSGIDIVILNCWTSMYEDATEVLRDMTDWAKRNE